MENGAGYSPARSAAHHGVSSRSATSGPRRHGYMNKEERDAKRARHAEKKTKIGLSVKKESPNVIETLIDQNSTVNSP